MNTDKLQFTIPSKAKIASFILMAIGLISIIAMFMMDTNEDPEYNHNRACSNVFSIAFFFVGISLASAFFLGLQYAAEAGWATSIKRVIEAITMYLPWGLSFLMLFFISINSLSQFIYYLFFHI